MSETETIAGIGHNSDGEKVKKQAALERLRSIVERIERLQEERAGLASDIRDIRLEAKSAGFNLKVLTALLKLRGQKPEDVEEMDILLDVYRRAMEG